MDYLKALERAILYIENHLGEDIKVEDAAAAAGYSYYHFTRQFNALLGESVGSMARLWTTHMRRWATASARKRKCCAACRSSRRSSEKPTGRRVASRRSSRRKITTR